MAHRTNFNRGNAQSANQYAQQMEYARQGDADVPKSTSDIIRQINERFNARQGDADVPKSTSDIIRQINERFNAGPSSGPATQGPKLITRKIPQTKPTSGFSRSNYDSTQQEPAQSEASTAHVDTRAQTEYAAYLGKEAEQIRNKVNVGNLPPNYNLENLYRVFEIHAGVRPLAITPTTTRCCVVNFETMGLAQWAAAKVNGRQILDKNLLVTLAGETSIQKDTSDIVARINARFKKLHNPNAVIDAPPAPAPPPPNPYIDNTRKMTPREHPYPGLNPPRAAPPYRPRMPMGQYPQTPPGAPPRGIPPRHAMPPQVRAVGLAPAQPRPQQPGPPRAIPPCQPTPMMPPHTISRHAMPPQIRAPGPAPAQPRPQQPGPPRAMAPRPPPPHAIRPQGIPPRMPPLLPTPPRAMAPRPPPPRAIRPQGIPPRRPPLPLPYAVPGQSRPPPGRSNQAPLCVDSSRAAPGAADRISLDQKVPAADYLIRMTSVPRKATTNDIRLFFRGFTIPPCGVDIIGGEDEVAFIKMMYHDDLLRANSKSGEHMMGQTVKMQLVTHDEMEKEKAHTMEQKRLWLEQIKQLKEQLEEKKKEAEKPRSKFSMGWRREVEKEKTLPNTAVVLKAKPTASATAQYIRSIMIDSSKKTIGNDLFKTFKKASCKIGDTSPSTKEDAGTPGQSASGGGDFISLFDSLRQAGIQTGGDQGDAILQKQNPTMSDLSRQRSGAPRSNTRKDDSGSDMEISDDSEADSYVESQRDARSSKRDTVQARSSRHRERKYSEKKRKKDEGFYILVRNFDPDLDEHDLMEYFTIRSVPVKSVIFKRMGETSSAFVRFADKDDKVFVLAMNGRRIANLHVEIIEVTKTRFKKALATYDTPSEDQRGRHRSESKSSDSSRNSSRSPLRDRDRSRSPMRNHGRSQSPIRDQGRSCSPTQDHGRSLKQSRDRSRSPIRAHPNPSHPHMPPAMKHNQIKKEKPEDEADLSFLSLFDRLRQAGIKTCDDDPRDIGPRDKAISTPQSVSHSKPTEGSTFMTLFGSLKQTGIQTGDDHSNDGRKEETGAKHDTADNDMDCRAPQEEFLSLFDALREAGIPTGDDSGHKDPMQTGVSPEKPRQTEKDSKPPKDTGFMSLFAGLKEAGISTGDSAGTDDPKSVSKSGASDRAKPSDQPIGNTGPWTKKAATKDDGPRQRLSGTTGDIAAKGAPWTKQNPTASDRGKPGDSSRDQEPRDAPWSKGHQSKAKQNETAAESCFMSLFEEFKRAGIPTSDSGIKDEPIDAPPPKKPRTADERPSRRDSPHKNDPKDAPWVKQNLTKHDRSKESSSGQLQEASFLSMFDDLRKAGIQTAVSASSDTPKHIGNKDEDSCPGAPRAKDIPKTSERPKESVSRASWAKKDPFTTDTQKQSDDEPKDAPWAPKTTVRQKESVSERSGDPDYAPWAKIEPSTSDTQKHSNDEPKVAPWERAKLKESEGDSAPTFMSLFEKLRQAGIQSGTKSKSDEPIDAPWTRKEPAAAKRRPDSPVDNEPKDAPWVKQKQPAESTSDTSFLSLFDSLRQAGIPAGGGTKSDDPKDAPWVKSKSARWSPELPESL